MRFLSNHINDHPIQLEKQDHIYMRRPFRELWHHHVQYGCKLPIILKDLFQTKHVKLSIRPKTGQTKRTLCPLSHSTFPWWRELTRRNIPSKHICINIGVHHLPDQMIFFSVSFCGVLPFAFQRWLTDWFCNLLAFGIKCSSYVPDITANHTCCIKYAVQCKG